MFPLPTYAGIIRIRLLGMFSAPPIGGHPLTGHLPVDCKGTNKKENLQGLWGENFPSPFFSEDEESLWFRIFRCSSSRGKASGVSYFFP